VGIRTRGVRSDVVKVGGREPASNGAAAFHDSPIEFTTTVTEWAPDRSKKWRTTGAPRLIFLGGFEMSFALTPVNGDTHVALAVLYNLPPWRLGRLLGRLLAAPYARWCVRQIARDARRAFGSEA
jgi:hypothetical protein